MGFDVPQLSDAIILVRRNADDTPTSHRQAPDDLGEYVDGSRKIFPLGRRNIVPGTGKYIADGGTLTALDPSDPVFGILTLITAPAKTLEYFYNYLNFTDADITGFIDQALTEMSMDETVFSPDGVKPASIPLPLFNALGFIAAAYAVGAMMERFAETFNSSTEGTTLDQSEIYKAYAASYKRNMDAGLRVREEYWGNQTRSKRPYTNRTRAHYHGFRGMPNR